MIPLVLLPLCLKFVVGSSIHGVLLCEWYLVSAHEWRRTFEQSNHFTDLCIMYISLIYIFFLGNLTLYINPSGFHLWHGIILNTIHLSVLLPFHWVFCGELLRTYINVKWMEPQNSILDLSYLSYLTGFKIGLQCVLKINSLQ